MILRPMHTEESSKVFSNIGRAHEFPSMKNFVKCTSIYLFFKWHAEYRSISNVDWIFPQQRMFRPLLREGKSSQASKRSKQRITYLPDISMHTLQFLQTFLISWISCTVQKYIRWSWCTRCREVNSDWKSLPFAKLQDMCQNTLSLFPCQVRFRMNSKIANRIPFLVSSITNLLNRRHLCTTNFNEH